MFFFLLSLIALAVAIGAVGACYYIGKAIIDDRKKNQKGDKYIVKFYINMVVKNKKEIIKDEIKKTIQGKKARRKTNFASKMATKMVHKAVSKEAFNEELVQEVAEALKDDFAEENIAAVGYVVYTQELYSVIGVDVKAVDVKGILCKELGLGSSLYDAIMGMVHKCFGKEFVEYALATQMLEIVTAEIVANVGPEIVSDLAEEGVDVDVVVKSAADQAPFFYALTKPDSEGKIEPITSWRMQAVHNGQWQGKTFKAPSK
uniref:Uncharacterized protein n=1 Tax=Helicotheca tamesis TaxID=374047 RepID=A0A7S2I849_9STRA|mmetsp:Transcript_6748/g.9107  ORF Transcript_6748/g.9107 Transcript_6748/m.9107 type:complete len:260 (+) Transcript_6748:71-850(+)